MASGTLIRTRSFQNRQAGYTDEYQLQFRREDSGHISVWALEYPEDPFGKSVDHHHVYSSGKLCQRSGYESRTLEHAEAFAHWWMKRWSVYVRTGTFPMTPESLNVPD